VDEIVNLAVFLIMDEASYVVGTAFLADGGMTAT
jgi:NAD(P)-dependent dehydrogenase (short-subunit alcohol dehydrogenase family)